jgi:hypothetical protein
VRSLFGPHAPNAIGVVSTVAAWWLAIVIVGLLWEWLRRPRRSR